jgi:hypothetical protein
MLPSKKLVSDVAWASFAQIQFVFQSPQGFVVDAVFVAQTDCGFPFQPE